RVLALELVREVRCVQLGEPFARRAELVRRDALRARGELVAVPAAVVVRLLVDARADRALLGDRAALPRARLRADRAAPGQRGDAAALPLVLADALCLRVALRRLVALVVERIVDVVLVVPEMRRGDARDRLRTFARPAAEGLVARRAVLAGGAVHELLAVVLA